MFLSKYGVARHIYIPVIKRSVVDFAVAADWTPTAGDVKISKDGGAFANVTNLPAAVASANTGAVWDFSLTATEMQAAQIVVVVSDAATKAVEDQAFIIETYGNASGQHAFDLGTSSSSGTAQAGAASTVTLAAAASAVDDFYNGRVIVITAGKGPGQIRIASDYVGSTKVLTVDKAWAVQPDSTSQYTIL